MTARCCTAGLLKDKMATPVADLSPALNWLGEGMAKLIHETRRL
jgi:hypothetical protein